MIDRSPLRSASERALSLCAAALVHAALALALPRAAPAASSPARSALQLFEITPAPSTAPAPSPAPTVPVPPAPQPQRKPRARSHAAPSPAAPAPTPDSAAPAPAIPLELAPAAPSDFAVNAVASEPVTSDRPGRLPVHSPGSRSRVQQVSGAPLAPAGLDRSRTLALAGGLDWRCAFPAQADDADVDRGTATLRITADAQGRVREVAVLQDSGHGFGRAARNCAFAKTFVPARGAGGAPVSGVLIVNVRFVR